MMHDIVRSTECGSKRVAIFRETKSLISLLYSLLAVAKLTFETHVMHRKQRCRSPQSTQHQLSQSSSDMLAQPQLLQQPDSAQHIRSG